MKWCELACQQLSQRTSQTNAASTANSSFTSTGSWILKVQKNKSVLGSSATSLWFTLEMLRPGGPCVVGKVGLVWYHPAGAFYEKSQIQSMKVLSCPQHPARIFQPARGSMRWRKDVFLKTVMISPMIRGFLCSPQWLRWPFSSVGCNRHLPTPLVAYQLLQWCIL